MFETFDLYEELIKKGFVPTPFLRFEKRSQKYVIGNMNNSEVYEIRELRILQQMWIESATEKRHWVDVKEITRINGTDGSGGETFDNMKFA